MARLEESDQGDPSVQRPLGMARQICEGRVEGPRWLPPSGGHAVRVEGTPSLWNKEDSESIEY